MPTVEIGSLKSSGVSDRFVFFYRNVVGGVLLAQAAAVDSVCSSARKAAANGIRKSPLIVKSTGLNGGIDEI